MPPEAAPRWMRNLYRRVESGDPVAPGAVGTSSLFAALPLEAAWETKHARIGAGRKRTAPWPHSYT